MGGDIIHTFPVAAKIFEEANEVVGFDLGRLCIEGPSEQLNSTTFSQPAIFTVSAALLEIFRMEASTGNIHPDVTAGLSLGEYTALYAAGVMSFQDGLRLVHKRGRAMQAAADANEGAMVSIIGLDDEKVRWICQEAGQGDLLEPVNFNCPGQVVVSGDKGACRRAKELAQKAGAIKVVRLEVAGAFHTKMMGSAADALAEALTGCTIADPSRTKTIANVNGQYYQTAGQIKEGLVKQLTHPILWQQCMEKLLADGIDTFYEIGPGRVLTGLMRRINRKANIINISSAQAMKELPG
jgi:[acyl-carrier-protein] S-malonyltransferase